jgi:hypothetical protein
VHRRACFLEIGLVGPEDHPVHVVDLALERG